MNTQTLLELRNDTNSIKASMLLENLHRLYIRGEARLTHPTRFI